MEVSGLTAGLATNVGSASKVAQFLDRKPSTGSYRMQNLWAVAHMGAHLALRSMARMLEEAATGTVGDQPDLFDVPADHAMAVREIEEFLDGVKAGIVGSISRITEPSEEVPELAEAVSVFIYGSQSNVTEAELFARFDPEQARAALDYLLDQHRIETDLATGTYLPAGGDLLPLGRDTLAEIYEAEVGKKAGKKSAEQLRAAILEARRLNLAKD